MLRSGDCKNKESIKRMLEDLFEKKIRRVGNIAVFEKVDFDIVKHISQHIPQPTKIKKGHEKLR